MFVASRKEDYEIKFSGRTIKHTEKHRQSFLDDDFIPILDFLEEKGLVIPVPTILDGWDATFIYRKLKNTALNQAADDLALFIYMRLSRRNNIYIEYSNLFSF